MRRYGAFDRRLRFTRLNPELDRLGYQLREITDEAHADYRRHWLPESRISLLLVAAAAYQEMIDGGDVWSISAPHPPELVAAGRLGGQRQAVRGGLVHLLQLDERRRRQGCRACAGKHRDELRSIWTESSGQSEVAKLLTQANAVAAQAPRERLGPNPI